MTGCACEAGAAVVAQKYSKPPDSGSARVGAGSVREGGTDTPRKLGTAGEGVGAMWCLALLVAAVLCPEFGTAGAGDGG